MVFWASVVGHFQDTFKDPSFLNKVNNALALSKDLRALELPTLFHHFVWDKSVIDVTLKEYVIHKDVKFKEAFVLSLPMWLKYASFEKIEQDIDKFISVAPVY